MLTAAGLFASLLIKIRITPFPIKGEGVIPTFYEFIKQDP